MSFEEDETSLEDEKILTNRYLSNPGMAPIDENSKEDEES